MKRTLILIVLFGVMAVAFAQKSYVTVYARNLNDYVNSVYLSGDVPSDMKEYYNYYDFSERPINVYVWIGNILNLLAERGYEVVQMNTASAENTSSSSTSSAREVAAQYLLARQGMPPSAIKETARKGNADQTAKREVARYNLQGFPVNDTEKGIQIIVFEDYTTKTVIVE